MEINVERVNKCSVLFIREGQGSSELVLVGTDSGYSVFDEITTSSCVTSSQGLIDSRAAQ